MPRLATPVIIVGAGPVGLALAIELGSRGQRCLVVERNDRVGYAPRAKTTHVRTRQHLRRWGVADKLAAASPFGIDYPSNVIFVTRLAGHELARFDNAFDCAPIRSDLHAEHAQWVPQYRLEEVLRAHVETLPTVELRFNCELTDAEATDQGVRSTITDLRTGELTTLQSAYLVGADGARSRVRELIGARMEGAYGLSRNYNIVFRAPGLAEAHHHGPGIMYWQVNGDAPSLIGPMDRDDRWFFMPTGVPDGVRISDDDALALIRRASGVDLPYEILSTDEWVASSLIADRYRRGRMFLAGDACHLHPPFGGYGMNMGVADAVDLGWKLAAVLEGWGGAGLLDSYERERRPLHRQVIDEAVANHALLGNQLWREGLEADDPHGEALRREVGEVIRQAKEREFRSLAVVLGYCYGDSPIISPEGPPPPPPRGGEPYRPSARPGCVAPHAWLDEDRSLYDSLGPGFTLLAFEPLAKDAAAQILDEAAATGTPLRLVEIDSPQVRKLYQAAYALIRPDQHVAWRGEVWPGRQVLDLSTGRL